LGHATQLHLFEQSAVPRCRPFLGPPRALNQQQSGNRMPVWFKPSADLPERTDSSGHDGIEVVILQKSFGPAMMDHNRQIQVAYH
jgi:hypothetical protein